LSYQLRLKQLNLPSFELRRLHIDLIRCYKILFGLVDLDCENFFQLCSTSVTRGHPYKLYKPSSSCNVRSHFFAYRVIKVWNSLSPSVNFNSLTGFKRSLWICDFLNFLVFNE